MSLPAFQLLAQATSPAHVGMDASLTLPVFIAAAGGLAFLIRMEVRQHFLGKDIERLEKDNGKRLEKLEQNHESQEARVQKVEQEQAVQAVTLGRIESGVERIEKRLDAALERTGGRQTA